MNADVQKVVERFELLAVDHEPDGWPAVRMRDLTLAAKALRDQDAEIARHVKVLADCFRMAGADPDGNEDWRIAPDALRAVTDLRRDYDEVLDWQDRAEKAGALLRETLRYLDPRHYSEIIKRITAHLGGEQ
jgi:hypothetical protein